MSSGAPCDESQPGLRFCVLDMDTFRLGLAARRRERERLPAEVARDHTRWTGRGTLEGG